MSSRIFMIPLPQIYKNRWVRHRQPASMGADLIVAAGAVGPQTFPDSAFYNSTDQPFEVTKMTPNITLLGDDGEPIYMIPGVEDEPATCPCPGLDAVYRANVRLDVRVVTSNTPVTYASQRISTLIDKDTLVWDFDAPVVFENRSGFQVKCENFIPSGQAAGGIRMELAFSGSYLFLGDLVPPELRTDPNTAPMQTGG